MGSGIIIITMMILLTEIDASKPVYGQTTVDSHAPSASVEMSGVDTDQFDERKNKSEQDGVTKAIGSTSSTESNITDLDDIRDCLSAHSNDTEANCNLPKNTTYCSEDEDLEESEELVSKETSNRFRFIVNLILLPLIAFPGCVCNVFNIFILTRESMRSSTHCYLTGLSIADFLFLLSVLLKWTFFMVEYFNKAMFLQIMMSIQAPILDFFVALVFGRTSNVLTLVISVERFVAVKFPLKAKMSPFSRHPIKIIVSIYIFVIVALSLNTIKYKFSIETGECSNTPFLVYGRSDLALAHSDFFSSYTYFLLTTFRFIPMILVFLLNCGTIIILKLSRKSLGADEMNNKDARQKEELKVTRMLITIAAIFIICVFPGFVHSLFEVFMPIYARSVRYRNVWTLFFTMYPLLDTVNAAVNFIVYIMMSKKFRSLCLKTIRGKKVDFSQSSTRSERSISLQSTKPETLYSIS